MKRLLVLVSVIIVLVMVTACASSPTPTAAPPAAAAPTSAPAAAPTTPPAAAPQPTTAPPTQSAPAPTSPPAAATKPAAPAAKEGYLQGAMSGAPDLPKPSAADMADKQVFNYADTRAPTAVYWDPIQNPGAQTRPFLRNLWLPLLRVDDQLNFFPGLALSWEFKKDFTSYIFHLDPKAVWSDGTPITAKDVVDLWTYAATPKSISSDVFKANIVSNIKGYDAVNKGNATKMEGLTAVDDQTVQIDLVTPDPLYQWRVTRWNSAITPVKQVMADPELWMTKPGVLTSGPFTIGKIDVALGTMTAVPNPKWWRAKPYLTEINFITVEDQNTQLVMFENKQLEQGALATQAWPDLVAKNIAQNFKSPTYGYIYFFFLRPDLPPLDDINVRQALVHAVDLETMFKTAWGETPEQRAKALIPPTAQCTTYPQGLDYKYDSALAKQELAKSKYGSVDKMPVIKLTAGTRTPAEFSRAAEIVLEMWKNNLGLTNVDYKMHSSMFDQSEQKMINIIRTSDGMGLPDTGAYLKDMFSSQSYYKANAGFYNPELEQLTAAAFQMQRNDPQYCKTLQEAEKKFWDQYVMIPLSTNAASGLGHVAAWVKNFHTGIADYYVLDQVWIAKH